MLEHVQVIFGGRTVPVEAYLALLAVTTPGNHADKLDVLFQMHGM
jgi:hypothetical protein